MALEEYPIQEGQHRSGCYFSPFRCKQIMSGEFMFGANCWYARETLNDDLNKLCGFSYLHHHWQSARLAWRPTVDPDLIEVWLYCYQQGQQKFKEITTVRLGERYKFSLMQLHTGTMGAVIGHQRESAETQEIKGPVTFPYIGYALYPYFGGDKPTPKNHIVYLDFRLK